MTFLKTSDLENIPQRIIYATFGYIRHHEKNRRINVPEMIKLFCLKYFNCNKDGFDENHTNNILKIETTNKSIILPSDTYWSGCGVNVNSYLKNKVSTEEGGVHTWRFILDTVNWNDSIGITRSSLNLDGDLNGDGQYAMMLCGDLLKQRNGRDYISIKYGEEYQEGSIIEMILDCTNDIKPCAGT